MRIAWLVSSIFLLIFTAPALAIKVETLYKGIVPVTTQAATERSQATQAALEQVLIKVSGNNQILSNPQLKPHLSPVDTLIQQYSYSPNPTTGSKTPYLLEIKFDPIGINQLLRDAGAPAWGQNRPLIVAWIAYTAPGKTAELVSSDSTIDINPLLKQTAEQRGLLLMLPLLDVTDLGKVSIKDVSTMTEPALIEATKRYASNAVLIGNISSTTTGTTSHWKLAYGNDKWEWDLSGKTTAEILPTLVDKIATTLASRFAVVTTNAIQKDIKLKVTGITQYQDFAQLTRYLNHLTPVANVEILETNNNELILKVSLRSNQESFIQTLAQGKKLTPTTANATDTMVVYQWNP